jgi:hypothetical protein
MLLKFWLIIALILSLSRCRCATPYARWSRFGTRRFVRAECNPSLRTPGLALIVMAWRFLAQFSVAFSTAIVR